ncbi:MAG: SusC/RagA family TonB-linked outer membrane protein [Bacteroidetes bacterium HGW-Bacteroidetes-1]|jgi:TonB-linked SusC/RagA family outer membrane protein|nr:MAG: SusC/RagA family TonB-linked outer membrane protein [Bacteroidetes bacterium HGW-Bacteroidetes-1]
MKKKVLLCLVLTLFIGSLFAQSIPVSGIVIAASDKLPVPGVTVQVKGTMLGTTTDLDGVYKLEAPSDAILVFTYVGMKTVEVPVKGQLSINLVMEETKIDLGEVVVVGYSTSSKKLISGSVGVVQEEAIKDVPLRTIEGVLQGKAAGVSININSGTPGGQNSIKLRGGSSINASNQPLIVVDGVPILTGSFGQIGYSGQEIDALSDLNPNDIESFTILKDASATAIYGSRASNGVILITTKKGSFQKTSVNLNTSYGFQTLPQERLPELMNAAQWNDYKGTSVQGIDTDWMQEILQTAPTSNTEISVSSGNDKTRLFISGNYYSQDGTVKSTRFDRYSGRLNVDHKLLDNLTVGGGIAMTYSKNDRVEGDQTLYGPLPNALSIPAIYPVYNPDGSYNEDGPYANPMGIINETVNEAFTNRNNGNIYLEYKFLNGFSFTSKWAADQYVLREHEYDPITTAQGLKYNGLGIEGSTYVSNLVSSNVLQYMKSIEKTHHFEALAGYSLEKYARRNAYIEAIDFPNENFQYITSAGTIRAASAYALDRGMNSYFGQFKYNYKYKYIFTLTARADGSSKFGKNNRYGYFPAASLAWRMNEESFMKQYKAISELKLRTSIGLTGNDGIGDFSSLGLYGGGFNYTQRPGIAPIQLPNPDLRWETTLQTGFGLDLALFENRISLVADVYYNQTRDLLLDRPLPPSTGYSSITSNIGELENKGFELVLNTENIKKAFSWNTSFNFAANRNKVLKLYENQPIDDQGRGGNRVQEGEPIGIFYGYNCLGVDPTTGNLVYEDINKDGAITAEDRKKIGNPNPDFTLGFTNSFNFKNFDLSIFLHAVYGNDVFNGTRIYLESGVGEDNQTTNMLRRWKQPGDMTDIPKAGDTYKSSRFIENGSFMRIKNVTFGYNFPQKTLKPVGLKNVRLYVTGQNLFTFTSYSGMDPEVNYYSNDNVVMGTDFFTYPQSRIFIMGLNIGL